MEPQLVLEPMRIWKDTAICFTIDVHNSQHNVSKRYRMTILFVGYIKDNNSAWFTNAQVDIHIWGQQNQV